MLTKTYKILFLCTGNTCRSQMAHAMSKQWVKLQKLNVDIKSRGIRAKFGEPTTKEALLVLSKAQINWQGTSSQLLLEDLDWADLVLGMTQEHLDVAIELGAGLLQDYAPLYQLLAYQDELVDPLNCGLARYQELYDKLQVLLPKRLAAI
ncbi:hypothetical protein OAB29_05605 [Oceanospirillaceae bacterium]|jgi:protein arginine phosphatase|nr:hypothetical protein [Oceanospirillaceae bacterium]